MREVCAFVEYSGERIARGSQEAVSEAVRIAARTGARCTALVLGHGIPPAVPEGIRDFGVGRALLLDDPCLASYSTDRYVGCLDRILREVEPDLLLMGGSAVSLDLAPRLSARLGCGLVTNATFLNPQGDGLRVTRAAYRPHASTILSFPGGGPSIVALAPGASEAERKGAAAPFVLERPASPFPASSRRADRVRVESAVREIPSRVDLSDAEVIVAGGKGMMAAENVRLLEELAEVLGGSVAASRMAVDLKWMPRECMVGVTGRTVSPVLYIACGISGAIQHRMGMQSSETVVAVNNDPDAPIFRFAAVGILGDVREVLPVMTETLRNEAAERDRKERSG